MSEISSFDRPAPSAHQHVYGSDIIAEAFRAVGMQYVAVCPGTSLRGFHDSVVNHLGNERPQLVTVLHEESAVAVAHGYAKVTGKAMGVMAHANVGLLHASMAVFNAWCDRVPMVVIGGVGPLDASRRRPWIDWIHTSQDLGAIVRDFTKWDDRPASVAASVESVRRAWTISHTLPQGPTYLNFDWELQEGATETPPSIPAVRDPLPVAGAPPRSILEEITRLASEARHPLLLVGRVEADDESWRDRVALAERFGMRVLTDIKARAGFPSDHPLHGPRGGLFLSDEVFAEFDGSDFVLSLDWIDLGTMTNRATAAPRRVVHVSVDQGSHRGWNADYQVLPTVDWHISCAPAAMVEAMLAETATPRAAARPVPRDGRGATGFPPDTAEITMPFLGETLRDVLRPVSASLVRVPLRWHQDWIDAASALDFLGYDGGFGLGSGPGMLVGAALALQGTGRLAVAVLGDGDTLMGGTAFWTAAHYGLPLLAIVANNASFYTDELHQERVARERSRPRGNKWIGQAISDPVPDLAAFARSLGISGVGPISRPGELRDALADAVGRAVAGEAILVDVRVHGS